MRRFGVLASTSVGDRERPVSKPILDIHAMMSGVDKRDREWFDRQTPELQKTFAPPVALRWASAVQGPDAESYLILVNEFANPNFHDLYQYPDLQYRLLALAGRGRPIRHEWIPITRRGKAGTALQEFVGRYYSLASLAEIDLLIDLFTPETFEEFVNQSGCSPEEAKDIRGVYKKSIEPKKAKR
jgi:hypothetical protein